MDEQSRQTPAPYAAGTGSVPVAPDRAAFDRMGRVLLSVFEGAAVGRRGGARRPTLQING